MEFYGSRPGPLPHGNGLWVCPSHEEQAIDLDTYLFAVITGAVTVLFGLAVWLFFPDNPLRASFLTPEERAQAILRIKDNHSGIEQKHFKKYQYDITIDFTFSQKTAVFLRN